MKRAVRALLVLLLIGGAGAYLFRRELGLSAPDGSGARQEARGRRGGRGGPDGPVAVLTAPSRHADVPVFLEAVGTAQALNTVTVRSQVDGRLMQLAFREGQDVRKGDVIARIDPTIYRAQYDQALAKKAQDEANVANARVDLQRYTSLATSNFGSKQQADTQRATVAQLEAQLKSDQGAIDNAKAYLDYTTIASPLDGRTGIRLVDEGNLVHAADTTGIVVITQLKPISVIFNLPQQNLRAVTTAAAAGRVAVEALDADNRTALDRGTLEVVDNQVDQTTGTVKLKASFPNADLQLWPGSFVNVRMTVDTLRDVVVVPTGAVQRGPNGAFVFGVADGKAALKPVTVGRETETLAVITTGLEPPEAVITTGFARLTDGEPVRVAEPTATPADGEQATPPRRGRRRDRQAGGDATSAIAQDGSAAPEPATDATGDKPAGDRPAGERPAGERRYRRAGGGEGGRPPSP